MSVINRSIMTLGENLFCGYWKFSKLKLEYYFLFLFTNENNYKSIERRTLFEFLRVLLNKKKIHLLKKKMLKIHLSFNGCELFINYYFEFYKIFLRNGNGKFPLHTRLQDHEKRRDIMK